MKEEIRQDGRTILSSEDGFSIRMFFNNLSGKNFSGKEKHSLRRNGIQTGYNRTLLRREESQDRHASRTLKHNQVGYADSISVCFFKPRITFIFLRCRIFPFICEEIPHSAIKDVNQVF